MSAETKDRGTEEIWYRWSQEGGERHGGNRGRRERRKEEAAEQGGLGLAVGNGQVEDQ